MDTTALGQLTLQRKEYAGIGSRETPPKVIRLMRMIGNILAQKGLVLRSGGADGADAAFEVGCDEKEGRKEIFLPWKNFNGNTSPLYVQSMAAEALAAEIHPNWRACTPAARKMHARNCHQILGDSLKRPAAFVVYYAPVKNGKIQGGTATGVHLALKEGIPCYNLQDEETFEAFKTFCEENL